ncbi:MAG TPA: CAP domain-containing protein [bacterium]|nr:CAP domain-containing protein [bacterium]
MMMRRVLATTGGATVFCMLVTGAVLAAQTPLKLLTGPAISNPRVIPGSEAKLFRLLNRARKAVHEAPLVMDTRLRRTARQLSRDMAFHGFLGHVSSSGETVRQRLSAAIRPGTVVGENVGLMNTVEEVNRAFLASPAHRMLMLSPKFRRVGIGVTTAGDGQLAITEDFAQ